MFRSGFPNEDNRSSALNPFRISSSTIAVENHSPRCMQDGLRFGLINKLTLISHEKKCTRSV